MEKEERRGSGPLVWCGVVSGDGFRAAVAKVAHLLTHRLQTTTTLNNFEARSKQEASRKQQGARSKIGEAVELGV